MIILDFYTTPQQSHPPRSIQQSSQTTTPHTSSKHLLFLKYLIAHNPIPFPHTYPPQTPLILSYWPTPNPSLSLIFNFFRHVLLPDSSLGPRKRCTPPHPPLILPSNPKGGGGQCGCVDYWGRWGNNCSWIAKVRGGTWCGFKSCLCHHHHHKSSFEKQSSTPKDRTSMMRIIIIVLIIEYNVITMCPFTTFI